MTNRIMGVAFAVVFSCSVSAMGQTSTTTSPDEAPPKPASSTPDKSRDDFRSKGHWIVGADGKWTFKPPKPTKPTKPPRYRVKTRMRTDLVLGGAALMGATWVATAIYALIFVEYGNAFRDQEGDYHADGGVVIIPLAGPFIEAAKMPSHDNTGDIGMLVTSGVVQAGGLVLLVVGLVTRQEYQERIEVEDAKLTVAPTLGHHHAGLHAQLRF